MDLLIRKRVRDVSLDDVLPAHLVVAKRLIDMLARVDSGGDPAEALDTVVLADPTTWQPLVAMFGSDQLSWASQELVGQNSAFFEWLALVAAREHLFLADWRGGVMAARRCLSLATIESVRDEAQNLLACGLHNLGDHAAALRELEDAIKGDYSVALLANIGVVAAELDAELAAQHLGRIVREAPTVAMRMNAARSALVMWRSDRKVVAGRVEGHGGVLPTVLREPLRAMIGEQITLDDFRLIVSAMADFDPKWLTARTSLSGSPHRSSLEAKYFVAKADGDCLPRWMCSDPSRTGRPLRIGPSKSATASSTRPSSTSSSTSTTRTTRQA